MAGNQLPVLTLDIDEEKIRQLQEISEKFKAAFGVGPGGAPFKPPAPIPTDGGNRKKEPLDKKPETPFDKFLKGLNKEAQGTLKTFGLINRTLGITTSALKGIFSTTLSWGSKLVALSVAGPFGYGLMARQATSQYRDSQGLGVTTGQLQAAKNVYGTRISGTDGIMQTLSSIQNDPDNPAYKGLMALGLNPTDGVNANLPKLLTKLDELSKQYKGTGAVQTVLSNMGLGFVGSDTMNQIKANSGYLPLLNQQYAERSQHLDAGIGGGTQEGLQRAYSSLSYNADRIGNTFLSALNKLGPSITKFSDSITSGLEKFISGKNGQAVFEMIARGLNQLSDWLASPQFQSDLKTFSTCVGDIVKALGSAIKDIHAWITNPSQALTDARNNSSFNVSPAGGTGVPFPYKEEERPSTEKPSFMRALGNTTLGLITGGNVTLDAIDDRWKAGGWSGYQDANSANVQQYAQSGRVYHANNSNIGMGNLTRGLRNNNPGNLNFAKQKGAVMEAGANGRFAVFPSMLEGVAALDRQLGLYMSRGINTIDAIVKTYAPAADNNNVSSYSSYLSKTTGLGVNERIDSNNTDAVLKLIRGIINMENGQHGEQIKNSDILAAMSMRRGQLARSSEDSRSTIKLDINQMPGSDISAQVRGVYIPPR